MACRGRAPTSRQGGATHCLECGEEIPAARRHALLGVKTCVACQSALDSRPVSIGFNRRGSKDSQLK
ncbi:TraR/DksA C4-type zinc finger protein [Pseudoroseomonas wenyumeiae]